MKVQTYQYGFVVALFFDLMHSDPLVILQLHEPPSHVVDEAINEDLDQKIKEKQEKLSQTSLSSFTKKNLKAVLQKEFLCEGILALYFGYCNYSDRAGRISFPLRHAPAYTVPVLICDGVNLQPIAQNTIGYMQLADRSAPYEGYMLEQKRDSANQWFWSVKKNNDIVTAEGIIPHSTIILLAKPSTFFVSLGDFRAFEGANIVLPPAFFVIQNTQTAKTISKSFDILRFFEPIKFKEVKPAPFIEQKIMENS